jgi:hypothetical protein
VKRLIRYLTEWAWLPVLEEMREKQRDTERHRDAVLKLYDGTKPWTNHVQNENARLRNLCFQMRMSMRRAKGRSMQCTPHNWLWEREINRMPVEPMEGGAQ